ncbi:MAG: tRNA (adenosine(37)-N6)-dimethylallyltransferase MiaA [Ignavibacteriae bacterium]|nr:tRNA (adenosine(37)-N6)-dimethylallyltransferase MiaA [Ignavibacteriota bacterium]
MIKPSAIAIVGATCSGKTQTSIELSRLIDAEIISADSRQIYHYLTIGTAKPTIEEQNACPHHFIDILNPDEQYSAGKFAGDARIVAEYIFNRGKTPLIVGGSGLYITALCDGIFDEKIDDSNILHRVQLEERLAKEGKEALYKELSELDSDSAQKYTDQNPRRIIRALEYYYTTGIPLSVAHKNQMNKVTTFATQLFGIEIERPLLYERINQRCIEMWSNGLVEETEKILSMGYSPELNSINTVGYKETIAYLSGAYTKTKAIEKMQQSTRNYAKRQLTWFRKNPNITWLSGTPASISEEIFRRHSDGK